MKKIDVAQSIQILANVGVIAGFVFLGVQIRNSQQEAQVANSIQTGIAISEWVESVTEDAEQADIFLRGTQNFRSLSEIEASQFDSLMRSGLLLFGVSIFARESNLGGRIQGPMENRVLEGNLLRLWDHEGVQDWWANADKRGIPVSVIQLIDELNSSLR